MKNELMDKIEFATKELESIEPEFMCNDCEDSGVIEKIEWVGTDTSYPKYIRCNCQYD